MNDAIEATTRAHPNRRNVHKQNVRLHVTTVRMLAGDGTITIHIICCQHDNAHRIFAPFCEARKINKRNTHDRSSNFRESSRTGITHITLNFLHSRRTALLLLSIGLTQWTPTPYQMIVVRQENEGKMLHNNVHSACHTRYHYVLLVVAIEYNNVGIYCTCIKLVHARLS